jgi:uncharacterized membrane-anchored protein
MQRQSQLWGQGVRRSEEKLDGKWAPREVFLRKPDIGESEVVLRAKVLSLDEGILNVEYGFERVYIAEGRGRNLKAGDRLEVDVVVDSNGKATVKELRGEGDCLYKWRLI